MKIAGLDTGLTTGLVVVNSETQTVIANFAGPFDEAFTKLAAIGADLVVLERAGRTQAEYHAAVNTLGAYGMKWVEYSPGEWKPSPHAKTTKAERPDWTQHERDALSLIKHYYIQATGRCWSQER